MPQYLSPGVYVEEVASSIQPIAGVGTSTAGFIGHVANDVKMPPVPGRFRRNTKDELVDEKGIVLAKDAPPVPLAYKVAEAGAPRLVTSWESFKNQFGDIQAANRVLAHAVYGFFNNGGTRCWVVRVAKSDTKTDPTNHVNTNAGSPTASVVHSAVGSAVSSVLSAIEARTKSQTSLGTNDTLTNTPKAQGGPEPTTEAEAEAEAGAGAEAEAEAEATAKAEADAKAQADADAAAYAKAVGAALAAFEAIDEIAIVAVPGSLDKAIQEAVVSHCERLGDRFAILDGNRGTTAPEWTAKKIMVTTSKTKYAALYFPWLVVFDPALGNLVVPPSGHVAGIYARVDGERGVHKAPANERVRGALGLEARLSRADHDGLNPAGINVIRDLNGAITVWGARTLGGDDNGEWKHVNVRRLFLYLRQSIEEGTQWVVFEPNTQALWSKIARNVTAFLTGVWRSGALFGATPAEAFYVRCDEHINPPDVREQGQVVTEIGVAVARPAEFVVFRISQWGGPGAA
jgi:hypothetical protein